MKVLDRQQSDWVDIPDAEALIAEARNRQRRRWFFIGIIVVIAMIVSGVSYFVDKGPSARARHTGTSSTSKTLAQSGPFVSPKAPYILAVAPNGDLLVVDTGRDQILRRLPSGKFQVVAGDGKRGFSGDGGSAVRARINVQGDSGLAVARNGTFYFADSGNGRVREVPPDGIIKTVAGGGRAPLGTEPVVAIKAKFPEPWGVFGLAIGPNAQLYIGSTKGVYRLGPGGVLYWVVGEAPLPNSCWDCNPGNQNDFTPAIRLAFDGNGDLLVAGGGGWGLYEMTRTGRLRFVGTFRGDGFWGSLAAGAGGTVVLAVRNGIFQFSPSGTVKPVLLSSFTEASLLNTALGPRNIFIGGNGVAASKSGDIYVDTNPGNTFTSVSAILELRPNGRVVALWKS